jgi:polyferredoxin
MKKIFTPRTVIQIGVFSLLIFLSLSHLKYGIEKAASIDAYCPYGAIESLITTITTGNYLNRIWTSSFVLMAITILATLVFGRVFCSYMCPLGALQEWTRALGRKIGIRKDFELPEKADRYARYLKYIILILIAYYSYRVGDLFFRNYDPYNALMHFGNEYEEKVAAYSILGLIVISALFSKNWWCRYLCPMGAFLAIIKKISPFRIHRNSLTCVSCGLCNSSCPANIDVKGLQVIGSADCISCLNCVSDCPESSLSATVFRREVNKRTFTLAVAAAFFLPISAVMLTPVWQTKAPSNIINSQGAVDVGNIRGSNSLKKVVEDSGIPLAVFIRELNLPNDIDPSTLLKNIGPRYAIKNKDGAVLETEDFREVIRRQAK